MARSRDVTVNLPTLDQLVPRQQRQELLAQLALLEAGRIKRRTSKGLDVDGNAFAPYSPRYAELRRRAGWSTKPDLWLRGGMLNSLGVVDVTPERATLGFQGSSPKTRFTTRSRARKDKKTGGRLDLTVQEMSGTVSNALKAYWNQNGRKPRRFFGVSAEDRVFLARHALRELLRIVGQVSLSRVLGRTK